MFDISDWSFRSLFERTIKKTCPVAHSSRIDVLLPTSGLYQIHPEPPVVEAGHAIFDVTHRKISPFSLSNNLLIPFQ